MIFSAQTFASRIRSRWRAGLWALAAVVLLTSVIELSHNHYLATGVDTQDCAVCQHSVSFDKALASHFAVVLDVGLTEQSANIPLNETFLPFLVGYQSRAPPKQLHV